MLLIARIVDAARLKALARAARDEGLEPLVEVVDEAELDAALAAGARVVGVNARDLDTLAMDAHAQRACSTRSRGTSSPSTSRACGPRPTSQRIAAGRADAALVGEALMRQDDPRPTLAAMVSAAAARRT